MLNALLPKGAPFFKLLLEQNEILCQVANLLTSVMEDRSSKDNPHQAISSLEEKADNLHTVITKHLSQSFITPIDREDILRINKAQEESIDMLHNMANRLYIFEFSRIRFPMLQLIRTIENMALLTRDMLQGLSRKRDCHNTKSFRSLRGDCEMLLSIGLAELYDIKEPVLKDVLDIMKWSQAYDRMERAVEQVVELAEAIEEAVLKNV